MARVCKLCNVELNPEDSYPRRLTCRSCKYKISKDKKKEWQMNNPTKEKEYSKKSSSRMTTCECGKTYPTHNKKRHENSKFHLKNS